MTEAVEEKTIKQLNRTNREAATALPMNTGRREKIGREEDHTIDENRNKVIY
jgi:hypothetical protein